ncbi:MAG: DEAD/DEAH box helicase [Saprospiraceae bacterium]|nr:MAG: SNF2-like protein [Bacteroidetes bacterium OLB9]MCO6463725.1 DEAD/DEAH box helicase [Saprospiraceae bacterium]
MYQYVIVYNLSYIEGLQLVLPSAYICDKDKFGQPGYIKAQALPENTSTYFPDIASSFHFQLLKFCHEMSLPELEREMNRNKKKTQSLSMLFSDDAVRKNICAILDRRLEKWLTMIQENQCYLCYGLQRKMKAADHLLLLNNPIAHPAMLFNKTQTGVNYSLWLNINGQKTLPHLHDIKLIANQPGMILMDNKFIIRLNHINSNKLKPFLSKEKVFIPNKNIKVFFEQFVSDAIKLSEVIAEGFELQRHQELKNVELVFIYNLITDKYCIDLKFDYGAFSFMMSEANSRRVEVMVDEANHVQAAEYLRNPEQEALYIKLLTDLQFIRLDDKRLGTLGGKYDAIVMVAKHYQELSSAMKITLPTIDNKRIALHSLSIKEDFTLYNDWFDLHGAVVIDGETYPIAALFKNIKEENPFFRLKSGEFVIIPEEIMTKYKSIVKFVENRDGRWLLSKPHFTLIEDTSISGAAMKVPHVEEVAYVQSNLLKATLRSYQREGVKWLIKHRLNGLGACLADDMGLGKTLQVIAALMDAKEQMPDENEASGVIQMDLFADVKFYKRRSLQALVVVPSSLIFNWQSELRKFAPSLQVLNYTGPNRSKLSATMMTFDVVITTYQTLVADIDTLKVKNFQYLILDESQQIRNRSSKTFQSVSQLDAVHKISMSGTPIENSLADLWSQMEFINPTILGGFSFFKEHFMNPIEKSKDEQALAELKLLVDPYILRRTKEQVAKDLPQLMENVTYIDMSDDQSKLYEREKSAVRNFLAGLDKNTGNYRINVLASLMKLRQLANHPQLVIPDFDGEVEKFEVIKAAIQTVVTSGHKVLVFSNFIKHLELFQMWMTDEGHPFEKLTGSMDRQQRKHAIDRFQNRSEVQVFFISIKAGGTGLNLTAADYVFILDPWWNPFVEEQAIARAHRIGQTENVMVTRFIARNTIEEKILKLQSSKKQLSDDIIDIESMDYLDDDSIEQLLQ